MNTESDLNKAIAEQFDMKQKDADNIVDFVQNWIVETTKREGKAKLHRYGRFNRVERKARTGRNPQTGEPIDIAASVSISFTPYTKTKEIMNA